MIAIEVTSKFMHIVEGKIGSSGVAVKKALSFPLPERSVRNGYIRQQDELALVMNEAFLEHMLLKKTASVEVDSRAIKTKRVEIPAEKRERALMFLKKEMGSLISDEEYVLDYTIHRLFKKGKMPYMECSVLAIPRELLTEYIGVFKGLGVKLSGIDVLDESLAKQFEMVCPSLKKANKAKAKNKKSKKNSEIFDEDMEEEQASIEIKGPIKLWAGLYYEKIKLFTNGVDGSLFSRSVMLEGTGKSLEEIDEDKELITFYIEEIKKLIQFQNEVSPNYPIGQIELFGEHQLINQICGLVSDSVKIPASRIQQPRQIKGVSQDEYARYMGAIGGLVRRK